MRRAARACEIWVIQVETNEARAPIADPASADRAGM
jgi:hypothetical protein